MDPLLLIVGSFPFHWALALSQLIVCGVYTLFYDVELHSWSKLRWDLLLPSLESSSPCSMRHLGWWRRVCHMCYSLNSIIEWENVNRNKHIPNYDVWEKCHWKEPPPHWQVYEEVMEIGHWASQWRFESSNSTCDSYLNREWEATILRKINEIVSEGCEWTQTPLYLKTRFYFFKILDFKRFKIASWHYTHVWLTRTCHVAKVGPYWSV